ncbi:hypothetical protein EYB25_007988 [Talaromyces marneffei]|uniref:Uncharacterized protein n=2 Tax=Talaromyces marneffei TaxID=37727 RepID=B6QR69_TALMQ|nr:conserved hypothetical protein [Talaromyces marneffei ATCC 18224]KAE8549466.1 hypothetical protein EYB25_007988 [Talaromyces marneffei]
MNPYVSWAIMLVVAGGLGYYYSNGSKPKNKAPTKVIPEKVEPIVQAPKPKKQKARKQPEPTTKKPEEKPVAASAQVGDKNEVEEDIDNKEFARRLAAARSGVSVGDSKTKAPKEKRNKQLPLTQESASSDFSTRAPSSNGADADDDLSSNDIVSPSGRDVSDMLEKPAPGPSVIRLTGSMETTEKKPKPQAFKQVETKKQRQNRQKNEARKQANQEAEAERRKQLEKQLHTAREAERQEANRKKSATSVSSNAWTTTNGNLATTTTPAPAVNATLPLLDTFESTAPAAASGSSAGVWSNNLPTEDEQMRILGVAAPAADEDWTTVSSKKEKSKKKAKADEGTNEASASESAASFEPETAPQPAEWVAPKVTQVPIPRGKNHPLDSDWAA